MYTLFAILIIFAAIILVLAVLVQNSKGGGLAANFASGNQTFGVRQTADFLEKITWYLVAAVFVLCFLATAAIPNADVVQKRSVKTSVKVPEIAPQNSFQVPGSDQLQNQLQNPNDSSN